MIGRTIHPDPECQRNQQTLQGLLDEEMRELFAYMNRVGNVTAHYYGEPEAYPTNEDYEDWLLGLPKEIAQGYTEKGFEGCKGVLSLRRFAAERNDIGLSAYMKESVSEEDYQKWSEIRDESLRKRQGLK